MASFGLIWQDQPGTAAGDPSPELLQVLDEELGARSAHQKASPVVNGPMAMERAHSSARAVLNFRPCESRTLTWAFAR
jgi:hypothetical protein